MMFHDETQLLRFMTHDVTLCLMEDIDKIIARQEEKSRALYAELTAEGHIKMAEIERILKELEKIPEHIRSGPGTYDEGEDATLTAIEKYRRISDLAQEALRSSAEELLKRRYPQTEIAEAAGVTRQTIVRWKQAMK
ncbi:hypothetical protein IDM48_11540 (plasmid) [Rothia amarae]|uniref:Uncharacterized protein n=1 Tax=Rothia amarae TaxID=169480 RepID=A0A7S6WX21_9MICC|nr:hypothetical protein [Rothia amarae]QOW64949.1 hypothetical protein IDM48_11540 [Rothia amarae]